MLSELYPPLARYCPNLSTVSAPQAAFLVLDHREAFYGGAAGGGKSDALLMAALMFVDVPGYRALILRRTFAQLSKGDALIPRSHEWLSQTDASWNEQKRTWTFPSGATLEFGHVEHETSKYDYQGAAFQFIGFDELTQFAESQYDYIGFSRARRRKAMKERGVSIRTRGTSNPGGEGHMWVKERFIENAREGVVFIPANVYDNPGLDVAEYAESLAYLGDTLRRQLLDGDWGVFEGAAFTITDDHLVDRFDLHNSHDRFEAADYGLNGAPWALWAADYEENLVVCDLLYERDKIPSQLAPLILQRRRSWWGNLNVAYVDPSIWHRTGSVNKFGAPAVLADEFDENGVPVVRANNDPRAGLIRLRERLMLDPRHRFPDWHPRRGEPGAPRLFFVRDRTEDLVSELRGARLQPLEKPDAGEKIDPEWESRYGHACAMARYAVMTKPAPSIEPGPEDHVPPHLRAAYNDEAAMRAEQQRELLAKNRWGGKRRRSTERV